MQEGSKRSVSWLLDYLKEERGEEKVNQMWRKVGNICVKTVVCILPTLVREYDSKFGTGDKSGLPAKDDSHTCNVLGEYEEKNEMDSSRPSTVASVVSNVTTASEGTSVGTENDDREEESEDEDSEESEDSGESDDEELDSEDDSEEASEGSGRTAKPTVEGSHCFEVSGMKRQ